MDDCHMQRKPSCATTKSTLFAVSKDEWDIKEDAGMSMNNTLYILQYVKRYLSGWSEVKKSASYQAIIKLRLSEGINQAVSQSVENSIK